MHPTKQQFLDMLNAHLAREKAPDGTGATPAAPAAEARQTVYERVRAVVAKAFAAAPASADAIACGLALEEAIGEIEARFAGSNWLDRRLEATRGVAEKFNAKYAALIALFSGVIDFLKPIVELSGPIMAGSGIGSLALFGASFAWPSKKPLLRSGAIYTAILFVCAATWTALQSAIPGATAKGVIAESVPGIEAVQKVISSSLGRIETETRRVGDLIEKTSRREQEERDAKAAAENRRREEQRKRITDAGFGLDSKGLLAAVLADFRYLGDFDTLEIKPAEADLAGVLASAKSRDEVARITAYLVPRRDDFPFVRQMLDRIAADRARIRATFEGPDPKAALCEATTYGQPLASGLLAAACRGVGQLFARSYATYARDAYDLAIQPATMSIKAPLTLPRVPLAGSGNLRKLPADCRYYELDLQFSTLMDRVTPMSDDQSVLSTSYYEAGQPLTIMPTQLDIVDPDYIGFNFEKRCRIEMSNLSRRPTCRARMIILSGCEADPNKLIKVIGG